MVADGGRQRQNRRRNRAGARTDGGVPTVARGSGRFAALISRRSYAVVGDVVMPSQRLFFCAGWTGQLVRAIRGFLNRVSAAPGMCGRCRLPDAQNARPVRRTSSAEGRATAAPEKHFSGRLTSDPIDPRIGRPPPLRTTMCPVRFLGPILPSAAACQRRKQGQRPIRQRCCLTETRAPVPPWVCVLPGQRSRPGRPAVRCAWVIFPDGHNRTALSPTLRSARPETQNSQL